MGRAVALCIAMRPAPAAMIDIVLPKLIRTYRVWLVMRLMDIRAQILHRPIARHAHIVERFVIRARPAKHRRFRNFNSCRGAMDWSRNFAVLIIGASAPGHIAFNNEPTSSLSPAPDSRRCPSRRSMDKRTLLRHAARMCRGLPHDGVEARSSCATAMLMVASGTAKAKAICKRARRAVTSIGNGERRCSCNPRAIVIWTRKDSRGYDERGYAVSLLGQAAADRGHRTGKQLLHVW